MASINLLPTNLLPNPSVLKLAELLKSLVTVFLALFVVVAAGISGYFLINSFTLDASLKSQDILKKSIQSMEQTEQSLLLVKDRLAKLKEIYANPSVKPDILALSKMLTVLPADASLTEADMGNNSLDTTFTVNNSLSLTQLMAVLIVQNTYPRVDLLSFSFNPTSGYVVSLNFINK